MTDTVIEYSLCLAVLTVILVGVLLPSGKKDKKAVRFMVLVIAIMAYISISMLSDVLEGEAGNTLLIYFSNLLTYLNIDFVIISFARYYKSMLGQITHKNSLPFYISMLMCCARTVLILVMFFCGSLFYVKDGYYHDYPTTIIPYIAVVAIMAVLLVGIIINRRNYTPKQFTVAIVYLLLPVPAVIVELLTDIYTLTGMALTICVLIIYALIQDIEIYRGKMRETMLEEISATDLLTGLNNRRTYYNVLGSLTPEQDVGVLFCDINGLKYTNDHYGHAAGDELIKRFADMLIDSFRSGEVFRISGDEFTVIIPDIARKNFNIKAAAFNSAVEYADNIAAIGAAYGKGCCVEKLISEAESLMYEQKQKQGKSR